MKTSLIFLTLFLILISEPFIYLLAQQQETIDPDKSHPTDRAENNSVQKVVFFTDKGCSDCTEVQRILDNIKQDVPDIIIDKYDIKENKNLLLIEAYCRKFNVPDKLSLIAPSLFCAKGFLVKDDINYDTALELILDSSSIPLEDWYLSSEQEMKHAVKGLEARSKKISFWVVLLAGLFDGINPCAFATIIFYLSYLRLTRNSSREIIQVGLAFIAGVFCAYFFIGMGLSQIITGISVFPVLKLWFDRFIIVSLVILIILCVYDGILCLRGKLEKISLQLPDSMKKRIRQTIRTGSGYRRYIIAAFSVGVIISFLELACTGQVYVPIIHYMLETGSDRWRAIRYLLLYNFSFVFPLIIIFIAVYFGLKNESLIDFMQKHSAIVKFTTALLFTIILLYLLLN